MRPPVDHRFIDGFWPLQPPPAPGVLRAGPVRELAPEVPRAKTPLLSRPVRQQPPRRFRSQSEKGPDCRASPASCPEFKNLAEQDQCSDDCGGLKING